MAATQAMLELLAWRLDHGESPVAEICMLKNQATQTMAFCASEAVQIFGGAGFMRGIKVERIYREVKVNAIGGGTRGDHEGSGLEADGIVIRLPGGPRALAPATRSIAVGGMTVSQSSMSSERPSPGRSLARRSPRRGEAGWITKMLFTAEHEDARHTCKNSSPTEINPHVDEWEKADSFPRTSCSRSSAASAFSGSTSRSSSAARGSITATR